MLALLGVNPLTAYGAMVSGVFGTTFGFTQSIVKATPLLLVGLGICIAFRASVINIGGEGQIILGALVSHLVCADLPDAAGLAPAAPHPDHGLSGRVALGLHPRHPEGPAGGQRNPEHRDDERHRAPAHELPHPWPVDRSGRRQGGHLPGPVRAAAGAGLACLADPADPAARRGHPGRGSGRSSCTSSCGAPRSAIGFGRSGSTRTRRATRASACRSTRRCR